MPSGIYERTSHTFGDNFANFHGRREEDIKAQKLLFPDGKFLTLVPLEIGTLEHDILESYVVFPEQFFPDPPRIEGPGIRIMWQQLKDAYGGLVMHSTKLHLEESREYYRQDWEWFQSNEEEYLYSFLSVCSWLQLSPVQIRRGIARQFTAEGRIEGAPIFRWVWKTAA